MEHHVPTKTGRPQHRLPPLRKHPVQDRLDLACVLRWHGFFRLRRSQALEGGGRRDTVLEREEAARVGKRLQGLVRPVLWRTMGFDEVGEAHQLMRDNKHLGKIAILVGAESEGLGKTADGPGAIRAEVGA